MSIQAEGLAGQKELWRSGENAYFEYHCLRCHTSDDAEAWYRDHQPVTVLRPLDGTECDGNKLLNDGVGLIERTELAMPAMFRVRFQDGHEHDVFEDELLVSPSFFSPELGPPSKAAIEHARSQKVCS